MLYLIGGAGAAAAVSGGTVAALLAIAGLLGLSFYALVKDYNVKIKPKVKVKDIVDVETEVEMIHK